MRMRSAQAVESSVYTQYLTRCPTMVCTALSFTKAIPQGPEIRNLQDNLPQSFYYSYH